MLELRWKSVVDLLPAGATLFVLAERGLGVSNSHATVGNFQPWSIGWPVQRAAELRSTNWYLLVLYPLPYTATQERELRLTAQPADRLTDTNILRVNLPLIVLPSTHNSPWRKGVVLQSP